MSAPRGTIRARWCAGLLLALAACAAPPRSAADVDTGRFNLKLATMYLEGTGVPRDDAKAAILLSNASAAGDIDAKELLGRLYAEGRGVGRDDALATNLFRDAVAGGNVAALADLGRMIETGRGTVADPRSALKYYERGMDAGDPAARQDYRRLQKSLEQPPSQVPPAVDTPQTITKAPDLPA